MRKIFKLFILLTVFSSCKSIYHTAPDYIIDGFTLKYNGKETNLDSLINITGYYESKLFFKEYNDTSIVNILFFSDGTYVEGFNDTNRERYLKYSKENIPEYFKEVTVNRSGFYEWFVWGSYYITGDTIKVQNVERPILGSSNSYWYAYEIWYKVIDRNTLLEIYRKPIHNMDKSERENFYLYQKNKIHLPAKFIPTDVQPNSDGWIKKEKWFWENRLLYEEYLKKMDNN